MPAPEPTNDPKPERGAGAALERLDGAWTKLETRLATVILLCETGALCAWISLKGLSAEYQVGAPGDKNISGLVYRALLSAVVLGAIAFFATRPKLAPDAPGFARAKIRQNVVVTAAVVTGLAAGRLWVNGGVEYFANFLNWMQSASILMLIGGLRGVATRLTLWLALIGASLATASGKHINIDVVMRFLTPRLRLHTAVLGWVAAAVMCATGAWGFFDHIAIALYKVPPMTACAREPGKTQPCPTSAAEKISQVAHVVGTDWFITARQLSLDARSLPRVVAGVRYYGYLDGSMWNEWVAGGDWTSRFTPEQVQGLLAPADHPHDPHIPAVSIPGGQEVRGLLIKDADLVLPFGLLMISLRFILRAVLALLGRVDVDPDAAHRDEGVGAGTAEGET